MFYPDDYEDPQEMHKKLIFAISEHDSAKVATALELGADALLKINMPAHMSNNRNALEYAATTVKRFGRSAKYERERRIILDLLCTSFDEKMKEKGGQGLTSDVYRSFMESHDMPGLVQIMGRFEVPQKDISGLISNFLFLNLLDKKNQQYVDRTVWLVLKELLKKPFEFDETIDNFSHINDFQNIVQRVISVDAYKLSHASQSNDVWLECVDELFLKAREMSQENKAYILKQAMAFPEELVKQKSWKEFVIQMEMDNSFLDEFKVRCVALNQKDRTDDEKLWTVFKNFFDKMQLLKNVKNVKSPSVNPSPDTFRRF